VFYSYLFCGERTDDAGVEESLVGHFQPLPPSDLLTHACPFAICPLITNPPQITCPCGWLEGDLAARLANISWHRIKFLEGNLANRKRPNPEWDHKRKNVPLCSTLWTSQCLPKEKVMRL